MALHYNPRIELSGLQLYVEAADPVCYPGSGQTVYDLSLNNRVLSSNMSESYLNGKVFIHQMPSISLFVVRLCLYLVKDIPTPICSLFLGLIRMVLRSRR